MNSTSGRYSSHFLGWCITYIISVSSRTLFVLYVFPLVWGWYDMIKANSIPKPANNSFQSMEVNLTSLSEIIFLGTPCNLKILFMKIWATSLAELVDLIATKWATLCNFSIVFTIASCCLEGLGKTIINSIEITSHFHFKMGIRCNKPTRCFHSTFTWWHSMHLEMKSATSFFQIKPKIEFLNGCQSICVSWVTRIWLGMKLI